MSDQRAFNLRGTVLCSAFSPLRVAEISGNFVCKEATLEAGAVCLHQFYSGGGGVKGESNEYL